jgi:subtilisin family serine protease
MQTTRVTRNESVGAWFHPFGNHESMCASNEFGVRVNKYIVHAMQRLLLPLAFISVLGACASPDSGSAQNPSELQQSVSGGAQRLTPHLKDQFDALEAQQFLPVIIRLSDQADLREAESVTNAAGKVGRKAAAISYLRQHAVTTQREILDSLSSLETAGLVRNVHPLWVVNVISAEVTAEAVDYLSAIPAIDSIAADTEAPVFLADASWSVRQINAQDAWLQASGGFTGEGIVVAVLDNGAELNHPDLVRRFWINAAEDLDDDGRMTRSDYNGYDDDGNGFVDDVVGWDFESGDNDPSPYLLESGPGRGHGTHVAGIIAGDGSNGVATGVAPGANLMILKINSQASAWAAAQYALDNGADIVNMSIGWTNSLLPELSTWRNAIDNLVDAGVLVVTSAGNGGEAAWTHAPAPHDITTPGRVPRALTVGAVAMQADPAWLDPIAPFSSGGPTSWQSVENFRDYPYPPGLLKPDMTAPGVDVNSTMIGASYQVKSGTSMATPHVSAVAALLLEKNPKLLPHELIFILRETAWRFVEPNNVRGWGRVDALQAIDHIYDPSPYDLTVNNANDLWFTDSIWIDNDNDGKPDDAVAGKTNRIFARIRNIGGQSVGNAEVRFFYADAGTVSADALGTSSLRYISSYYAPIIGPSGTSQDSVVATADWLAPVSENGTNHWTLGVDIVAPNPPNKEELDRTNNTAFTNHFDISMFPGEIFTFRFFIHDDPRDPGETFDLEIIRRGLPQDFDVLISLDDLPADERVGDAEFANKSMKLLADKGHLEHISLPDSRPVAARITIHAPEFSSLDYEPKPQQNQYLVVNAANKRGIFGGFTLNISIDPNATPINKVIYSIK